MITDKTIDLPWSRERKLACLDQAQGRWQQIYPISFPQELNTVFRYLYDKENGIRFDSLLRISFADYFGAKLGDDVLVKVDALLNDKEISFFLFTEVHMTMDNKPILHVRGNSQPAVILAM